MLERSCHIVVRRDQTGKLLAALRGFEMDCIMECCRRIEMESVGFFVQKLEMFVTREWEQGHWNYSYHLFIPADTFIPLQQPKQTPTLLPVPLESLDPSLVTPQWKCLLRGRGDIITLHLPSQSVERLINYFHSFSIKSPIESRYFFLLSVHGGIITFSSLQGETPQRMIVFGVREYQALYLNLDSMTLTPCILTRCRYESLPWSTRSVFESESRLQVGQCYSIQHTNHFVIDAREYYVITEQSTIQHGILKDTENHTRSHSISSVASLLSNVPQTILNKGDFSHDLLPLSHLEYEKIQKSYFRSIFRNILFTPSSLLLHINSDMESFWLMGILVDCLTINETGGGLIRLRDLTTDVVIQLRCEEWPERVSLGSVLCVTNLFLINAERIVFSKFSSFFTVPNTAFLHSILPDPPLSLSCPLSSIFFTWQTISVEFVVSLRVFTICDLCRRPITSIRVHSYLCPQGHVNNSVVFVELSFYGYCGTTKVKGYVW